MTSCHILKINKNEVTCIGRKSNNEPDDSSPVISLDDSYSTVSNVSKPHVKIFYEDNHWCVLDDSSSNGTFISDRKVLKGVVTKLKNNSFLKLSKGPNGAVIYCSYD